MGDSKRPFENTLSSLERFVITDKKSGREESYGFVSSLLFYEYIFICLVLYVYYLSSSFLGYVIWMLILCSQSCFYGFSFCNKRQNLVSIRFSSLLTNKKCGGNIAQSQTYPDDLESSFTINPKSYY